ncbi:hypothetical protein NDU88_006027 [Pleurodeles waltl]|uniref:Uncharacterized protein n=1 Tax=Pleurodeles waltl TaxID=8319 RepID=A0AAV7UNF1_PLEWA|nr:hypothetical protein NDU88_006027 [Pleurodeles waltl]
MWAGATGKRRLQCAHCEQSFVCPAVARRKSCVLTRHWPLTALTRAQTARWHRSLQLLGLAGWRPRFLHGLTESRRAPGERGVQSPCSLPEGRESVHSFQPHRICFFLPSSSKSTQLEARNDTLRHFFLQQTITKRFVLPSCFWELGQLAGAK